MTAPKMLDTLNALRWRLEVMAVRHGLWLVPAMLLLAACVAAGLEAARFPVEERPFAAHVTLLRHADCTSPPPAEELRIEWPVKDFVLVESELRPGGASYRILQRWPLDQT